MKALYTATCSCVNVDGVMSDWFSVSSGVMQDYTIAPDLFLGSMDRVMERTVHRGMNCVTLGDTSFTDLDFADDVASTRKTKTKIMQFSSPNPCSTVQVADGLVEVANSFVYLGSMIDSAGDSRGEILRKIGLARTCMNLLGKCI